MIKQIIKAQSIRWLESVFFLLSSQNYANVEDIINTKHNFSTSGPSIEENNVMQYTNQTSGLQLIAAVECSGWVVLVIRLFRGFNSIY